MESPVIFNLNLCLYINDISCAVDLFAGILRQVSESTRAPVVDSQL